MTEAYYSNYRNEGNMYNDHVLYKETNFSINKRYRIRNVLGKGSYGTVCAAIDTANPNSEIKLAIKKVSNIFAKEILLKRAIRELKLMKHFKGHKNIVNLVDLEIVYTTPYEGLYCFQEMADYDLARVIYSSTQFSEFHIKSFLYQILCGLKYIHSADVIHRDLKPGNILVTIQGNVKICDFGLARGVNSMYMNHRASVITNYVATRWYRAPELMLSDKMYGKAVDMWAVGCILAELYGRRPLFVGKDQMHQLTEIVKVLGNPAPDTVNKHSWKFLAKVHYKKIAWEKLYPYADKSGLHVIDNLICWDPYERMTVEEVLNHPFLQQVRNEDNEPECRTVFDFSFEKGATSLPQLNSLLEREVVSFKQSRLTA